MLEDRSTAPGGEATILGLDNVALSLPIAGVGSRVLAGVLDYALQFLIQIAWLIAFAVAGSLKAGWTWGLALYIVGVFLIDWAYFAGSEILLHQQTPGKKAVRLRVVTSEGGTPSVGSLLARNLTRVVDMFVGIPMIALDPLGRRLGDRLAGTLVVHESARASLLLRRVPEGWTARDIAAVEALLDRTGEMEPDRLERLAGRLLETLRRQHPDFLAGFDDGGPAIAVLRRAFGAEKVS